MNRLDCPKPHKIAYPSKSAAKPAFKKQKAAESGDRRDRLMVYECSCGMWHIGHSRW